MGESEPCKVQFWIPHFAALLHAKRAKYRRTEQWEDIRGGLRLWSAFQHKQAHRVWNNNCDLEMIRQPRYKLSITLNCFCKLIMIDFHQITMKHDHCRNGSVQDAASGAMLVFRKQSLRKNQGADPEFNRGASSL